MTSFADKPKVPLHGPAWTPDGPTPTPETLPDGQKRSHWVLPPEERAKGFVRPVRRTYRHLSCDTTTSMPQAIAETFARDPEFYGSGFCCHCRGYFPNEQFVWDGTSEKVGW